MHVVIIQKKNNLKKIKSRDANIRAAVNMPAVRTGAYVCGAHDGKLYKMHNIRTQPFHRALQKKIRLNDKNNLV